MDLYAYRIHAGEVVCRHITKEKFGLMSRPEQSKYVVYIPNRAVWVQVSARDEDLPLITECPTHVDPRIRAYHLINS